jgi:hypothetical protein
MMNQTLPLQPSFPGLCPVTEAVNTLATAGGVEERGAIFTRREVVEFILDLVGYTSDQPLARYRLLEPSFGDGDFLLPALDRLLASIERAGCSPSVDTLGPAIRAVELHRDTFHRTRTAVIVRLQAAGLALDDSEIVASAWLTQGDFLLQSFDHTFTHVVGNPPYVRQESVPDILMAEYRKRYATIYDRADIYVPFIELSLRLLDETGKLGFICADRWMKNKYGQKLRELVSRSYSMTTYVDMVGTDAFHAEVSAYPAITVIERGAGKPTRVFARPAVQKEFLDSLAAELTSPSLVNGARVQEIDALAKGSDAWVLESFDALDLARRLERQLPLIEEAGCKVGIGVATGADRAFIGDYEALDVEPCRKLPLVMTRDIASGEIAWRGKGVINPFADDGRLVKLEDYPKLKRFLEDRKEQIAGRHVAEKSPQNWYRTIDRIYPDLTWKEKLLIPDIRGDASIIHEPGQLYPHHNLYFVTSSEWDVRALQAVMRSGIARLFVSLYSTKMRGGYLRFQAQYLRKIRLPYWHSVPEAVQHRLAEAARKNDADQISELVAALYGLSNAELRLIGGEASA